MGHQPYCAWDGPGVEGKCYARYYFTILSPGGGGEMNQAKRGEEGSPSRGAGAGAGGEREVLTARQQDGEAWFPKGK